MYLSDSDFISMLVKLRDQLHENGKVFIKENRTTGRTYVTESTFEGATDRSLVRSNECFDYIFKTAGYRIVKFEAYERHSLKYDVVMAIITPDPD